MDKEKLTSHRLARAAGGVIIIFAVAANIVQTLFGIW